MITKADGKTQTSEMVSLIAGHMVLPVLMVVTAGAVWAAGKALGGDVMAITHGSSIKPVFDMALNVQSLTDAGTFLAGTSALWGIATATTHTDISELGTKFKNFGAGITDFASKVGHSIGLVKEGETATNALNERMNGLNEDTEPSFLARATCKFVQAAGVSAVAAGGIGLARIAFDMPSLVTNPGTSTLAIGAAAAVGVGGALYLLAREGLKTDQSKDGINFQLNSTKEATVEVKKEPSYRVLSPGEY
jgi:hypothetical protein